MNIEETYNTVLASQPPFDRIFIQKVINSLPDNLKENVMDCIITVYLNAVTEEM